VADYRAKIRLYPFGFFAWYEGGRIVPATIQVIHETTEGKKLQVDFGFDQTRSAFTAVSL
jgi:hypothetical protein